MTDRRGERPRRLRWLLAGAGMALLLWAAASPWHWGAEPGTEHRHAGPTLEQLLPLSSLVTLRIEVSDVLETRLGGLTGGTTAVVLVKGDVEMATDLAQARFEEVDESSRTAVLHLPQPAAGAARLDLAKARVFGLCRDGLWLLVPGDYADARVINKAYAEAQDTVARAAADGDKAEAMRQKARDQAERVLATFFDATGWRVTVRWEGRP